MLFLPLLVPFLCGAHGDLVLCPNALPRRSLRGRWGLLLSGSADISARMPIRPRAVNGGCNMSRWSRATRSSRSSSHVSIRYTVPSGASLS